jgi:hypothetical protein
MVWKGERALKCSNGRVTAVVRSSRVPVGVTQFVLARPDPLGRTTSASVRSVLFDHVLDETQLRLLEDARRLAESSCLDLEIVDLGKVNPLRRALFRVLRGQGVPSSQGIHLELPSLSDIETAFNSSIR